MAEQPGIMVYFDVLPLLAEYSAEEAGTLFISMLEYGRDGVVPEFDDRSMLTLWKTMQGKIDRDAERYRDTCESRKFAAYCREERKHGREPIDFEDWKAKVAGQKTPNESNDTKCIQQQPQPNGNRNPKINGNSKNSASNGEEITSNCDVLKNGDSKGDIRLSYEPMTPEEFNNARDRRMAALEERIRKKDAGGLIMP